jgi:hypothetical protein
MVRSSSSRNGTFSTYSPDDPLLSGVALQVVPLDVLSRALLAAHELVVVLDSQPHNKTMAVLRPPEASGTALFAPCRAG